MSDVEICVTIHFRQSNIKKNNCCLSHIHILATKNVFNAAALLFHHNQENYYKSWNKQVNTLNIATGVYVCRKQLVIQKISRIFVPSKLIEYLKVQELNHVSTG